MAKSVFLNCTVTIVAIAAAAVSHAAAPSSTATLTAEVPAGKFSDAKNKYQYRLAMTNLDFANSVEHVNHSAFAIDGKIDHQMMEGLRLKAAITAGFRTGYSQTRFGGYIPKSGVSFLHAFLDVNPVKPVGIQLGMLDQVGFGSSLLLDQQAFPAVLEKLTFGEEYKAELVAQQAIPTSSQTDAKTTTAETTPTLFVETLKLSAQPKNSFLHASVLGGHWMFQNLPASVATSNDVAGNTLDNSTGVIRYKYEFEGWFANLDGKIIFSDGFKVGAHTQLVQNTRAPEGYRNAQMTGVDMNIKLPHEIEINPGIDYFFAESDASPGAYNSGDLGHSNRKGVIGQFIATFNKQKLRIVSAYIDAELINPSAIQRRHQIILIRLDTLYGIL